MDISSDTQKGAKELIRFLEIYTELTNRQIINVKSLVEETTANLMDTLKEIDLAGEDRKKLANALLIRRNQNSASPLSNKEDGEDSYFQSVSSEKIEESEKKILKNNMENKKKNILNLEDFKPAKENFQKHMGELDYLDDKIKQLLFAIMGSLSNDDVLRQRLDHISLALDLLNKGFLEIIDTLDLDKKFSLDNINQIINVLFQKMYQEYSMEEEKKIFHSCIKKENIAF